MQDPPTTLLHHSAPPDVPIFVPLRGQSSLPPQPKSKPPVRRTPTRRPVLRSLGEGGSRPDPKKLLQPTPPSLGPHNPQPTKKSYRRNASSGSSRTALRAGTQHATPDATTITAAAISKFPTDRPSIPYTIDSSTVVRA